MSSDLPVRKSPRLWCYDYRHRGAYFITTNTHRWRRLFGEVVDQEMIVSNAGAVVADCWRRIATVHPSVLLDAFVVMPHHVHGILLLRGPCLAHAPSLSRVIGGFKSFSAIAINRMLGTAGERIWHRSFHDRVIRDGREMEAFRRYIAENPARWQG